MADLNGLDKPVGATPYADVWDTIKSNFLSALKMDGAAGKAGRVAGIKTLTKPSTGEILIQEADAALVNRTIFDSREKVSKTAMASQAIASSLVLSGEITGSIDSASTMCSRSPVIQGTDLNTVVTAGARLYAAGNAINTNSPIASPQLQYGMLEVLFCDSTITQKITEWSNTGYFGRVFVRSWYTAAGPSTAVWREVLHAGDDITVKSIRATNQSAAKISYFTTVLNSGQKPNGVPTVLSGNFTANNQYIFVDSPGVVLAFATVRTYRNNTAVYSLSIEKNSAFIGSLANLGFNNGTGSNFVVGPIRIPVVAGDNISIYLSGQDADVNIELTVQKLF